ncbi:hypothetical protein NLJ89_g4497 [Agrocybe chaxingu]|uniref:UBC core domain-containing protein n=1 Tax=Agrocybe chaxingu TaxID=84603 RepID=A0A9W8K8N3_9AGAR|nr:hypothetical protein NLJ89_g4497 [Agrocybe chaxingu]
MHTRTSKRSAPSPQPSGSSTKRPRKAYEQENPVDVIVLEDSDNEDPEDPELKDILAQIDAQEASERLARQLERENTHPVGSGSKDTPIDIDDDEALARRLAEEWAAEENSHQNMIVDVDEMDSAFDRQLIAEKAAADCRASTIAKTTKSAPAASVGPGGTGYGRDAGYPASRGNNRNRAQDKVAEPSKKALQWETTIVRILKTLVELLPAPYAEDPQVYDMLPHPSIGHLISLSQLPALLASLLRNDSVTDWISRKETYNAMLLLLRRMADSELTIQCLIGQRWETATTCGLENWMWQEGEITWRKSTGGELEIAPALYTYFKKLTKQSHAFQVGAMQMLGGDAEEDVDEMMIQGTSLCGDIIATSDDLERAIAVLGQPLTHEHRDNRASPAESSSKEFRSRKKGKGRDVSINVDEFYVAECERLAFKHVSLADPNAAQLQYTHYNYAQELNNTQTSTRRPRDRLHLLKELAVTATSLPPGVWVRVDEVRNDAIKIMIAGPEGTPYSGGLFEFDCFIPIEYPNRPPLMHLRTTGNGTVRFNPNLYNNGKVCLSLLGTWPGRPEEQWSPKSTLLQVLVSIQSMILIDAPYYNEPGHGQANVKAPVSIAYNRDICGHTTRRAIVDWLKDEHKNGIWRDVIYSHFTIRKDKIRQQIVEWSKSAPQIRAYSAASTQAYCIQPFSSGPIANYGQGHNQKPSKGLDLLEEYDKGIKIIDTWKTGDEAE